MERLGNDRLYLLLFSIKDKPWVFLGQKSLRALENFITGYMVACSAFDPECFTIHWYNIFYRYVCDFYHIYKEKYTVFSIIRDCGYSDSDGLQIYFELLENFSKEKYSVQYASESQSLQHGEVRAFRLDNSRIVDFATKYINEHSEDFFGIPISRSNYTYVNHLTPDNILTCMVCGNASNIKYLNDSPQINQLPVFSTNDLIRYTVLFLDDNKI